MENRNFQLESEWNIIHYPKRPTGFGILILGDERHFVDENNSFWLQNEGKLAIINQLKQSGYTIFSSNLYGRNWGSDKAAVLAHRLYQHVLRTEIMNDKIHMLAEGMGALVGIKLLKKMDGKLRSAVFLNPILSLKHHLDQEKKNKFFYKKLTKELEAAYQLEFKDLEAEICDREDTVTIDFGIPIHLIHILSGGRSYNQASLYQCLLKQEIEKPLIQTRFIVPEKKQQIGKMMIKFFQTYEKIL